MLGELAEENLGKELSCRADIGGCGHHAAVERPSVLRVTSGSSVVSLLGFGLGLGLFHGSNGMLQGLVCKELGLKV